MSKVPKLLKPYYSLSAVFNRLNSLGGHLDSVEDILLIAREGDLDLSIFLPEQPILIRESEVTPFRPNTVFEYEPSGMSLDFAEGALEYSEGEIWSEIAGINHPTFFLPRKLGVDSYDAAEAKIEKIELFERDTTSSDMPVETSNQCSVELDVEIIIKPPRTRIAKPYLTGLTQTGIHDPVKYCLATAENCYGDIIFEINNEMYYLKEVTEKNFFSSLVSYRITFKDGSIYCPRHRIGSGILGYLQRKELLVVSKPDLQRYEKIQLDIDHEIETDRSPVYLDKDHPHYAKEIAIAIEAHTAIFINGEGSQYQSNTVKIENWLRKHYPNESTAFYDRIKTVVNPKK